jgi:hypothetical protein
MLYLLKIRVVEKPWLGQQKNGGDKIRKFRRDKKNRIAINQVQWQWAMASAAKSLEYDIDVETIRTESGFDAPTMGLYNRRWVHKGKPHEELFECIREGSVLSIPILVMESGEIEGQQYKAPTRDELEHVFEYTGMFIGLSPWGSKWGYGLYEIVALDKITQK